MVFIDTKDKKKLFNSCKIGSRTGQLQPGDIRLNFTKLSSNVDDLTRTFRYLYFLLLFEIKLINI